MSYYSFFPSLSFIIFRSRKNSRSNTLIIKSLSPRRPLFFFFHSLHLHLFRLQNIFNIPKQLLVQLQNTTKLILQATFRLFFHFLNHFQCQFLSSFLLLNLILLLYIIHFLISIQHFFLKAISNRL